MISSVQASIELVNRALAERPIGATLREPTPPKAEPVVEVDDDPEPFRKALPHSGPWKCAAGCGAMGPTPGVCEACGDAAMRAEAEDEFRAALDSIPTGLRWARVGAPELDARCGWVYEDHDFGLPASRAVTRMILDKIGNGSIVNVILRGNVGIETAPLACAAMRLVIDRGIDAWIAYVKRRPANRCVKVPPEPPAVSFARGARFISTRDLLPLKAHWKDVPEALIDAAIGATLLVLDGLGEEAPLVDGAFDGAERPLATSNVVAKRWGPSRPIIGTTTRSDARLRKLYGDEAQFRLTNARRVVVLELEKQGGTNG